MYLLIFIIVVIIPGLCAAFQSMGRIFPKKYSITRVERYRMKYNGKTIKVLEEFKKKNNLTLMYFEDFMRIYNSDESKFTLNELIEKLERICSKILPNGHLDHHVSADCIEEKLSRHHNEKKYDIIMAIDERNISHYACDTELIKIKRAGGKKRRNRLMKRYTYENPLNRIHGFVIYNNNPGPDHHFFGIRAFSIDIIGANPYSSQNGFKAIGANLLLYIIMLAKIHKFDKVILEISNDKAEIEDECNINETGENDTPEKAVARKGLEKMTRKQLKKIAKYYFLPLGGLKLHIINQILWHEYDAEWDEDDFALWGEESDDGSDEESDDESEDESDEESEEESDDGDENRAVYGIDSDSDSDSEDGWYYPVFEPLYKNVDIFQDWDYDGKDPEIYGYGGKRYLEGKKSMMKLYSWYVKRGFIENMYLNTHYKYFDMTPLPSMEFQLDKWSMKKICLGFLDNKNIGD